MSDAPLVRIDTAEETPPLVIELPSGFPWQEGERELYREATDDEFHRYSEWYLGYNDALEPRPPEDRSEIYAAGYAQGVKERPA